MSYSKANSAVSIFQDISPLCDNMLSAPYSVHKLHKSLLQNQFTPPKPFRKIILMTDDNFSIYNTTSILGEIMIFFFYHLVDFSPHRFFSIMDAWDTEIIDNGNENVISKSFARVYKIQQTIFSFPSFNRYNVTLQKYDHYT